VAKKMPLSCKVTKNGEALNEVNHIDKASNFASSSAGSELL